MAELKSGAQVNAPKLIDTLLRVMPSDATVDTLMQVSVDSVTYLNIGFTISDHGEVYLGIARLIADANRKTA